MVHLPPIAYQMNTMNGVCKDKLPSLKSVCQNMMVQQQEEKSISSPPQLRHHFRARSLPTTLPSNPPCFTAIKRENQSYMDVLLKAIALDEKMGSMYKKERVKNFVREQQWLHKIQANNAQFKPRSADNILVRRRSRSAPGAPMAHYYHHVALNSTRWYLPNHDDYNSYHNSHDIAYSLVQQHLKSTTDALKK